MTDRHDKLHRALQFIKHADDSGSNGYVVIFLSVPYAGAMPQKN